MPGVGAGRHRQDVPLWDGRRGSVVPSGGRRYAAATLIVRGLLAADESRCSLAGDSIGMMSGFADCR